jgi:hypothetical protein
MTNDLGKTILSKLDGMAVELVAIRERLDTLAALPVPGTAETPQPDAYLTVAEASAEFKLSTDYLYRLKHLQHRHGRAIRFRRSELQRNFRPDPLMSPTRRRR